MLIDAETRQQVTVVEIPSSADLVSQHHPEAVSDSSTPIYRPSSRGRGYSRSSGSRVQCQLCGKTGHLVDRCYHRFDATYKSAGYRPPPQANMCLYMPNQTPWALPSLSPTSMPSPSSWPYQMAPTTNWSNPFLGAPMQSAPPSTTVQSHALLATPETVRDNAWYPDSGATHHLTHSAATFRDNPSHDGLGKVYVGNGNAFPVLYSGQSSLITKTRPLHLKSLLFAPGITKNLLSVSKFMRNNQVMFEFLPTQCQVRDFQTKEVLLRWSLHCGLYRLHLPDVRMRDKDSHTAQCLTVNASAPLSVWHSRLGHPCKNILLKVLLHCNVSVKDNKTDFSCVACHLGKECKLPFSQSLSQYTAPLQLVTADVWGPAPFSSNGFRYYVAFTDACTRYTWLYFLRKKSEVLTMFQMFHKQAERALGKQLCTLQTDNGGEFQVLKHYLAQHGITQRFTCSYTSVQNGIVEHKHRQIVKTGLSMLVQAFMPVTYWNEAFSHAIYLINRLPSAPLGYVSPYEKLFQTKPNYTLLRTFGCLCFPNLKPYNSHKLQFRSTPCTFLGYSPVHKGYRCRANNGRVYISRHVTFHEEIFPFKNIITKPVTTESQPHTSSKLLVLAPKIQSNSPMSTMPIRTTLPTPVLSLSSPPTSTQSPSAQSGSPTPNNYISQPSLPTTQNIHAMTTRSKAEVFKLKAYLSGVIHTVPDNVHEAMAHAKWKDAVHAELRALVHKNTWTICPLPSHHRTIGYKWLFKVKQKADGTVERYKARLVAKGFSKHAGTDFKDTFSPVVRAATIRTVLALAMTKGWPLHQVDVNNAFLNGELTEEIFMDQPPGFEVPDLNGQKMVCKLNKALYGLRQALRAWFHTLKNFLISELGF
ncbi:hypothetical protein CXB51_001036 [Gossypium anomalum]|uniref:Integrase catalytic domain-containing protein n=1 Tax=Gossypium anomalum TaxID=47600 RepID=A0A8J5ZJT4_9ROSI|nr:hypothetical protein CXB51_001036 [Gossypium anomalum]